jgi:undecaprenyl-diphosphatase
VVWFGVCAAAVRAGPPAWDAAAYRAINEVPHEVAVVLTPLARLCAPVPLVVLLCAAALGAALYVRSPLPIVTAGIAAAAGWALSGLAKSVADRPRPYEVVAGAVLRQQPAHGSSFPSSHTSIVLAVVLALVAFLPRPLAVVAVLYGLLVAWSRVYLGVHYPLDVLAGVGVAMGVGGVVMLAERLAADRAPPRPSPPDGARAAGG